MDTNKLSIADWIKIASILFLFGALYSKVDAQSDLYKSSALESKEYRLRLEKLELSMAEIKLEIQTLQYNEDVKRRDYDNRHRGGDPYKRF